MGSVLRPEAFRHQHLYGLTHQLFPGVAEELLCLGVGHGDDAVSSGHEHPIRSRLDHLPVLLVRPSAARPLCEQRNDQPRLEGEDPNGTDDVPVVQIPEARLPEADITARRQARRADAPTPQLTPVEHGHVRADARHGDLLGSFASQNAQGKVGRVLALHLEAQHVTTNDPAAHEGVCEAVDGSIRGRGHELERFGWNEDLTGGITRHGEVEDDAAVGKSGHLLQEIVHRQPRQVHELDPAFVRAERPPCHSLPIDIERRAARDDEDPSGFWMEAEGDLERDLRVELDRNADDVGRQLVLLHSLLVDVHEHDGNTRKDLIAKLQRELQRGAEDGHDEIDRFARVFFPEELGQSLPSLSALEA